MDIKFHFSTWIILLFLFFFIRFSVLYLAPVHALHHYQEAYRSVLTLELLSGEPFLNIRDYIHQDYEGGTLLAGFFLIPFVLLFGISGYTLKIAAITIGALTLLLLSLFLYRFFGREVAMIGALLYLFPSTALLIRNFHYIGNYPESALLTLALLYLSFSIYYSSSYYLSLYFLLGLMSGFSLWYHYINLVAVLLSFFILQAKNSRWLFTTFFSAYLLGFLLTLTPWYYTHLPAGLQPFPHREPKAIPFTQRLPVLLTSKLPSSFGFHYVFSEVGVWMNWIYYLIAIGAMILTLFNFRHNISAFLKSLNPFSSFHSAKLPKSPPALFLSLYLLLYFMFYLLTGFQEEPKLENRIVSVRSERYVYLTQLVFLLLIASMLGEALIQRKLYFLSLAIFSLLLFMGIAGIIGLVSLPTPPPGAHVLGQPDWNPATYPATDYSLLRRYSQLHWYPPKVKGRTFRYTNFYDDCFEENLTNSTLSLCLENSAWMDLWRYGFNITKALEICHSLPLNKRGNCTQHLALIYGWATSPSPSFVNAKTKRRYCDILNSKLRKYCYLGIGWNLGWRSGENYERAQTTCFNLSYPFSSYCLEGIGEWIGWYYGRKNFEQGVKHCYTILHNPRLESGIMRGCWKGLGASLVWKLSSSTSPLSKEYCNTIPPHLQKYCLEGRAFMSSFNFTPKVSEVIDTCNLLRDERIREACREKLQLLIS